MKYIERDENGLIEKVYSKKQYDDQENIEITSPEYIARANRTGDYAPDYKEKLKKSLPSIGDQLTMMHQDLVDGTTKWQDMRTAKKSANPKS